MPRAGSAMCLDRFIDAQERIWPAPLQEIRAGRKRTHWMWFVFPQLKGLGRSAKAQHYGIKDLEEACRFLAHPVLGPRLEEIAGAFLAHDGLTAEAILGPVDAMKLRSSATLFEAAGGTAVFAGLLDSFFEGERCGPTLSQLRDNGD